MTNIDKFKDEIIPKTIDFLHLQGWKKVRLQVDFPFTDKMKTKYAEFYNPKNLPNCYLEIRRTKQMACSVQVDNIPEYFYYDLLQPEDILESKIPELINFLSVYASINKEIYEKRLSFFNDFHSILKPK